MSEITIPTEALEAAEKAILKEWTDMNSAASAARAAIRAALAVWPGVAVNDGCPVWHAYPHIILPLNTENPDAEA